MTSTASDADQPGGGDPGRRAMPAAPGEAVAAPETQDAPMMDMHGTTDSARLDGVVDQTRADVQEMGYEQAERLLRQRLDQVGIQVSDDEFRGILARITSGA